MNNELNRFFHRETVRDSGVGGGKVIRQRGGIGVYAHVRVAVDALIRGRGNVLSWEAGLNIPAKFASAVAHGVQDAMNAGVLAGLELIDVHVSILDGSWHEEDSTSDAFREAAEQAVTQALRQAHPLILESLSMVRITVPIGLVARVHATLASLGAQDMLADMLSQTVSACLPTSEVDDLIGELLEITGGHAKISSASAGFRPRLEPPDSVGQWVTRT